MQNINNFEISEDCVLTKYCGKDSTVVIPEGVKEIDRYVFFSDFIKRISIPDSIESIDETNFSECKNLEFNVADGAKYLGNESNPYLVLVSADDTVRELNIKDGCKLIMERSLAERRELVRVFIPSSVRYIGYMAFYRCEALSELTISDGVIKICACAFDGVNLKKINLPDSVTHIEWSAFSSFCPDEVTLPDGILHIGNDAFVLNDTKLREHEGGYYLGSRKNPYVCFVKPKSKDVTHLSLHKECKIIYSDAFMRCESLKSVTLPEGLLQIGNSAFRECLELESVNLPESLTLIDENAFASCKKLKDIKIPKSEITIESGAFMSCKSIENIELARAVVGDNAFDSCEGLKTLTVGEGSNLYGDYIFAGCVSLGDVVLPKKLENRFTEEEFEDSENVVIKYV